MAGQRVDLQTAAELLGISSDAVRKRAKRGTIPYETGVDGKLYVWVDEGVPSPGRSPGETDDYPREETGPAYRDELVEELRDRVRALEEANRENRRIIAGLIQRVPELEAPRDERDARETVSEDDGGTETPAGDTGQPRRSSWWRRWFGFD